MTFSVTTTARIGLLVFLISLTAAFGDSKSGGHPFVQRIESMRVPRIDIADASLSEILEFVRIKTRDWDSEPNPSFKGFSILTTTLDLDESKRFKYKASDISVGTLFQELARLLKLDFHVTDVGVVVTPAGQPPFPNAKSAHGAVLKTYKSSDEKSPQRKG